MNPERINHRFKTGEVPPKDVLSCHDKTYQLVADASVGYNGPFTRMACDYIHATGMTHEEVEELLKTMKHL